MIKQVKSKQRVADHGEVFTAEREVKAMCDLVKQETERIDSRFLEPACGDGNFLAEVISRKLTVVRKRYRKSVYDYERNSLLALGSIYGIDILQDNAEACRKKLFDIWNREYKKVSKKEYCEETRKAAEYILSRNIVCGNALTLCCVDADGKDTKELIVFSEWTFPFNDARIQRKDYTFDQLLNGNATSKKKNKAKIQPSLFEDPEPEPEAEGKFLKQYIAHYKKVFEDG
ncbi:MAG: hypothetical protein WC958_02820 [Dehalococcoidales bacterium]